MGLEPPPSSIANIALDFHLSRRKLSPVVSKPHGIENLRKARNLLPLWFMLPATVAVALFFFAPVVLTFVISFTSMSSQTGILGERYVVSEAALRILEDRGLDPSLVERLGRRAYAFDEAGLAALRASRLKPALVDEIEAEFSGKTYASERTLLAGLKRLKDRPSFRQRKAVAKAVARTLRDRAFTSVGEARAAVAASGLALSEADVARVLDAASTGWSWTLANYREMLASRFTLKILGNTAFYVFFTLFLNVGFAMVLALTTFYMPAARSKFFRAVWLIPRISPSVIYVMLWKWFTFDGGFLSYVLGFAGVAKENWLLEYPWTFIVLINGFVGASMGMIIFSSAVQALPRDVFHAAQVDGAYPWQQVRRIILPQLAWPVLFITSYQTLSLLTSFEYIQLATDGGPGFFTTETWSLHAFHTALASYFGNLRYGFGAALAVVLVVLGVALALLYLRSFNFRRLVAEPRIEV